MTNHEAKNLSSYSAPNDKIDYFIECSCGWRTKKHRADIVGPTNDFAQHIVEEEFKTASQTIDHLNEMIKIKDKIIGQYDRLLTLNDHVNNRERADYFTITNSVDVEVEVDDGP
jgi:hypothetical protein